MAVGASARAPGVGHNFPPEIIDQFDPEILAARLERDHADLAARFTELELGAAKVPAKIATEAEAEKVTEWVGNQCKALIARAEREHAREKKPYLDGGRIVDRFFLDRIKKLRNAFGPVERRVAQYYEQKKAEQRRREEADRRRAAEARVREEAEARRLAAEARKAEAAGNRRTAVELTQQAERAETNAALAAAQAVAPPAPVAIHGEFGATAFAVERWDYEIVDLDAVPDGYWTIDDEAIRQAVAEGKREIPGLRIFQNDRFQIRRC
jgi:hypothetical protein